MKHTHDNVTPQFLVLVCVAASISCFLPPFKIVVSLPLTHTPGDSIEARQEKGVYLCPITETLQSAWKVHTR